MAGASNPEMVEDIEAFIKKLPKEKKAPRILGSLYEDKSEEEQEKAKLATLSNVQWLLYPFKKMIASLVHRIMGKKKQE